MFNPDLLTPAERKEILELCATIQEQCSEIHEMIKVQTAAVGKVSTSTKEM